jgi:hypothetical protein
MLITGTLRFCARAGVAPGMFAEVRRVVTAADVAAYAALLGDANPLHLDADFAARTAWGRPIAHGMLTASFVSTVLGTKLPGPGAIYLSQTLRFKAPVRAGDTVVQAYFRPLSTPSQPASKLKAQLFDYARVHLAPGASAQVPFTVDSSTLRLVDKATGASVSTPGSFTLSFEDGVAAPVTAAVTITGSEVLVAAFPF